MKTGRSERIKIERERVKKKRMGRSAQAKEKGDKYIAKKNIYRRISHDEV